MTLYVWVRVWNGVDAWNELAGSASGSGFIGHRHRERAAADPVDTSGPTSAAHRRLGGRWIDPAGGAADLRAALERRRRLGGAGTRLGEWRWDQRAALEALRAGAGADAVGGRTRGVPDACAWLDARDPGSAQVLLRQFFVGATFPLTIDV